MAACRCTASFTLAVGRGVVPQFEGHRLELWGASFTLNSRRDGRWIVEGAVEFEAGLGEAGEVARDLVERLARALSLEMGTSFIPETMSGSVCRCGGTIEVMAIDQEVVEMRNLVKPSGDLGMKLEGLEAMLSRLDGEARERFLRALRWWREGGMREDGVDAFIHILCSV